MRPTSHASSSDFVAAALAERVRRGEAVVAGVLSGTSGDGIDVVLCRFGAPGDAAATPLGPPEQLAFETRPFPPELGERVRAALDHGLGSLAETAVLSRDLGRAFGDAARALARDTDLSLELVGSHGQTVYHHDGGVPGGATLQLGDGDFAARAASAPVVSDFRQADLAAGGEGAPLSALADDLLFHRLPRPSVVLNLGGIANVTFLGPGDSATSAFDTGPAGALLDGLARRLLDQAFDAGGAVARTGTAHSGLIDSLLAHPFFERTPPKSTGRDTFGEAWVDAFVARAAELGVTRPADLLATAVGSIARHVADGVRRCAPGSSPMRGGWLVVCGGGAHNATLMDALARELPLPVATGADFGVDPDAREALVFAVLAARCVLGLPSTNPAVTGARPGQVLGKLSQAGPA